jgi:hypothetical protein
VHEEKEEESDSGKERDWKMDKERYMDRMEQ